MKISEELLDTAEFAVGTFLGTLLKDELQEKREASMSSSKQTNQQSLELDSADVRKIASVLQSWVENYNDCLLAMILSEEFYIVDIEDFKNKWIDIIRQELISGVANSAETINSIIGPNKISKQSQTDLIQETKRDLIPLGQVVNQLFIDATQDLDSDYPNSGENDISFALVDCDMNILHMFFRHKLLTKTIKFLKKNIWEPLVKPRIIETIGRQGQDKEKIMVVTELLECKVMSDIDKKLDKEAVSFCEATWTDIVKKIDNEKEIDNFVYSYMAENLPDLITTYTQQQRHKNF